MRKPFAIAILVHFIIVMILAGCSRTSAPDTYNKVPLNPAQKPGYQTGNAGRFDTKDTVVVSFEDTLYVRDTVYQNITDTIYNLDTLVLQDTIIQTLPPVIQPDGGYQVFMKFKRTPCYGTCPWYEVTIWQNGLAVYKGEKFVDMLGNYETVFTPDEMKSILRYAYRINFFNLPDTLPPYRQPPTDLPKVIMYLQHSGIAKQVVDNRIETPAQVTGFENFVENLIYSKIWHQID